MSDEIEPPKATCNDDQEPRASEFAKQFVVAVARAFADRLDPRGGTRITRKEKRDE